MEGSRNRDTHWTGRGTFSALISINITSCESERNFSAHSLSLSKMGHSLKDKKVEKMMFLRLNAERVPEIRDIKEELLRAVESTVLAWRRRNACKPN